MPISTWAHRDQIIDDCEMLPNLGIIVTNEMRNEGLLCNDMEQESYG
jgi:hypothetical protein